MNKTNSKQSAYHHGNLRQALIEEFIRLLSNLPAEKISMRKLASSVGVAPAAVYNHFSNKFDLEIAVKTKCLNHFADYLNDSQLDNVDARERIRDLGIAYFNYSNEHPRYFHLIMGANHQDATLTDDLQNASMRAEESLRDCVKLLLDSQEISANADIEALGAFACWSLAHGVSVLSANNINLAACSKNTWPQMLSLQTKESIFECFNNMSYILADGIVSAAKQSQTDRL